MSMTAAEWSYVASIVLGIGGFVLIVLLAQRDARKARARVRVQRRNK